MHAASRFAAVVMFGSACGVFPTGCGGGDADGRHDEASGGAASGHSGAAGHLAHAGHGGEVHESGGSASAGTGGGPPPMRTCTIAAPTSCSEPVPTYEDVQPIFAERCVVCHAGTKGGPWALDTYGHVATWRDTVRAALISCAMPPVDSGLHIPDEESLLVLQWIRCGMPI